MNGLLDFFRKINPRICRHPLRAILFMGPINWLRIKRMEKKSKFKNFISVVAIAKNEGANFAEWIEFHRVIGVEKFYIYDNNSTDNTYDVLRPYIESGIVEYIPFPGERMQVPAYLDAIEKFKDKTKWMAFIDLDEFIVPISDKNIVELLRRMPRSIAQVLIGWVYFGSNGHTEKQTGMVLEKFKRRASTGANISKAIVNPRLVADGARIRVHTFRVAGWTTDGYKIIPAKIHNEYPVDKVRINHYFCKSLADFYARKQRGDAYFGPKYEHNLTEFNERDRNEILDTDTDRYIAATKRNLNG